MPLRGQGHSGLVSDEEPYFKSLAELDAWFAQPHDKLSAVLAYQPRHHVGGQPDSRGKLLVCHDYKGGYTESPSGLSYTFNFWPLCDTFVYFSHHRVTIPPSGWTNAAHKQGTKMLGTLIFERSEDEPECLQLLVGRADCVIIDNRIPLSERYAVLLAELAYQRGFDGYLLNFEYDLKYGTEHARALAAWILLLRAELRAKVGPHAQAVWYDSVIYDGRVCHQDRLNGYNLPFFLASDTFFTNYTWPPEYPALMVQYFMNLNPSLLYPHVATDAASLFEAKSLQSIYTGVDVWGRGQYGGGGFCSYRAITHIDPASLGLSVAFFGPGWTWESEQSNPGWDWNQWWDYERKLWLGPPNPGDIIPVPVSPEGPFKPMTAFFRGLSFPDPAKFPFYTHFSPGVGFCWFVEGKKVLHTEKGWTDIDKQCSIGNLVWPRPTPLWEGFVRAEDPPAASSALDMTDGYNGGSSLKLTLTCTGSESEDAFKYFWLPVQSLTVTTRESFEARVVCKAAAGDDVDLDFGICVKSFPEEGSDDTDVITVGQGIVSELPQEWTQQTIDFTSISTGDTASVAIGFLIGVAAKDPSTTFAFSIALGQLSVYPTPPEPAVSVGTPSIPWVKFAPSGHPASAHEGILTWDVASTFAPADIHVESPDSTSPAWLLLDTPAYRVPTFAYFNVYAVPLERVGQLVDPTSAVFVGTTGLDGRANRFYVEQACLPDGWGERDGLRFYIQGLTDHGEVLPWENCAAVDHWKGTA